MFSKRLSRKCLSILFAAGCLLTQIAMGNSLLWNYSFDGSVSNPSLLAVDSSANSYDGVVAGNPVGSTDVPACLAGGNSWYGDNSDWIDVDPLVPVPTSYTVAFWAKPDSQNARIIFTSNPEADGIVVWQRAGGNFRLYHKNVQIITEAEAGVVYPTAQWVHVAVTVDAASRNVVLYVDGNVRLSKTASDLPALLKGIDRIAGRMTGTTYHYRGFLDDCRFYDYALTGGQIQLLAGLAYNQPPTPDLNDDGRVDLGDLLIFAGQWLDTYGCAGHSPECADLSASGGVNNEDVAILSRAWAPTTKFVYTGLPKFACVFNHNMVLQRDTVMNVWGLAKPRTEVTVSLNGQDVSAAADMYGKWLVQFAPMPAGGPYSLTLHSGQTTQTLTNVLIGDVWICSGQSNMRYGLNRQDESGNYIFQDELTALQNQSTFPIRHFMQEKDNENTEWFDVNYESVTNTSLNVYGVTAVGYFFAKHLRETLGDVPIGIIQTGMGGKAIRHFIPKDMQWDDPELYRMNAPYWQGLIDQYGQEQLSLHEAAIEAWLNGETGSQLVPVHLTNFPGFLFYEAMPQIRNMKFKGMLYYQGESDAGRGQFYRYPLAKLIDFHREYFNFPEMPFIDILLPPYALTVGHYYPDVADSILAVADEKSRVGAAYAPEAGDYSNIHPPKKEIIGRRAAMAALVEAYGGSNPYLGPRYKSDTTANGKVIVTFQQTGGGLVLASGATVLTGFQVAGADGVFIDAEAYLGAYPDDVEITIPAALQSEPRVYVRHHWTGYYEPVLYGRNGLPALFLRTDNFPLETTGRY